MGNTASVIQPFPTTDSDCKKTITKTPNNSSSDVPSIVPPKEDKTTTRSRSSSVYDNGFILFTS